MNKSLCAILTTFFLSACGSNSYKEPSKDAPHAVFETNGILVPIEINGQARSGMKLSNWSYRLTPGQIDMFVNVQVTGKLRAEGVISFFAEQGQTYEAKAENLTENVKVEIINKESKAVATSKLLPKTLSGGTTTVPIFIPAS